MTYLLWSILSFFLILNDLSQVFDFQCCENFVTKRNSFFLSRMSFLGVCLVGFHKCLTQSPNLKSVLKAFMCSFIAVASDRFKFLEFK